jgi:ABC-type sugar transport system permease subunit
MVAPAVALLLAFLAVPIVQGVRLSFSNWSGVGPTTWAGLKNYGSMASQGFGGSLWLTLKYSTLSMAGTMILATLLAAVISAGVPGSRLYRVIWFLPGIAPGAAVAVFWASAVTPQQGAVNALLGYVGLGDNHAWLSSPTTAIYVGVFVTVWASAGFAFLLLLGAMEQVPKSLYEAARVDGANTLQSFRHVTMPLIRRVFVVVALLELIWAFNGFTLLWAMTAGGPGFSTSTLPIIIYRLAFNETNFGTATAMAVTGGLILTFIGVIALRISRSKGVEGGLA